MDGWMDRGLEGWRNGGEIGKGRVVVVARTAVDDDDMGVLCNEGSLAAGGRYLPRAWHPSVVDWWSAQRQDPCHVTWGLPNGAASKQAEPKIARCRARVAQDNKVPGTSRGNGATAVAAARQRQRQRQRRRKKKKNLCWRRDTLTL